MRLRIAKLLVVVPILVFAACGGGGKDSNGTGTGGGGGGVGGGGGLGNNGGTGNVGGSGGPTFGGNHPRILLNAANLARIKSNFATVPVANGFQDMVNRAMGGEDVYGFLGQFAALLYQITGTTSYANFAVSFIDDKVAAEEALIARGMAPDIAFDSYLYVGDQIMDLALVYDWCFDFMTDAQRTRWRAFADQAVWNVWHPEQAKWGNAVHSWSGWSIDNPSDNYYYSFLEATQSMGLATQGEDPMAEGWLDMFRNTKLQNQLVPTFAREVVGGGSREGTGYGIEMRRLFSMYDRWFQTTGERIADVTPHTETTVFWLLHATAPTLDRVATIGDQARESSGLLFDDDRDYVQNLAFLYPTAQWAPMAQWYFNHSSVPRMDREYYFMSDIVYQQKSAPESALSGLNPTYYAKGAGHVFARSGWTTDATYLTYLAGGYTESHAHADQGSFQIYKNEWLAFDEGVLSNSGLRQEEAAHNIPVVVAGGRQAAMEVGHDGTLTALADNAQYTYVASDTANCYMGRGGITQMEREMVFVKPGTFIVFDRIQASAGSQKVWHLSTPIRPTVSGRVATIMGTKSRLTLTPVLPAGGTTTVVDWRTADSDSMGGYRIDLPVTADGRVFFLNVMSVDGAVSNVTEASSGGMRGVTLTLADGRTVTAQFTEATFGGNLDITGGSGPAVHAPLSQGVAELPRYSN